MNIDLVRSAMAEPRERHLLASLRARMFSERAPGNAFNPLSDKELALLELQIRTYRDQGRFRVADNGCLGVEIHEMMAVLRHDHITGRRDVSPAMFRSAATAAISILLAQAARDLDLDLRRTTTCMTWRGALAFAMPAFRLGCRRWHHLGAGRNEETAEPEVYYRHPFILRSNQIYLSGDPMLATGGTQIAAVEELLAHGVREENIIILALVSAPEGVDRLLSRFKTLRVMTAAHDERLNSRAYIEPGLGDFGDKFFTDFPETDVDEWLRRGILDVDAHAALVKRMRAMAA